MKNLFKQIYNYIDMSYCNYGLTELIFHLSNEFN